LIQNFLEFSTKNNLDVLLVLTGFLDTSKVFHREVVIFEKIENFGKSLVDELLKQKELLELVELRGPPIETMVLQSKNHVWFFQQKNIQSSRKQIQPLVHLFFTQNMSKM